MTFRVFKTGLLASALALIAFAVPIEKSPNQIVAAGSLCLIPQAHAVVGRPLTPVSYAGVARRTSRRTVRRVTRY